MTEYNSEDEEYVTKNDVLKCVGQYEGERNEKWQRHGNGKAIYENGDKYQGEFSDGHRHGEGIYKFKQARYDGSYKNGKRNGFGTMVYPDQSQYKGFWKDGKRHGKGEYAFGNGDTYIGEYEDDVRHGTGTYQYAEMGGQLTAKWVQGRQLGPGCWKTCSYSFEGEFEDYVPCGPGKFTFSNGCEQHGYHNVKNLLRKLDNTVELIGKQRAWQSVALVESTDTKGLP